jgi:hypothetical protein
MEVPVDRAAQDEFEARLTLCFKELEAPSLPLLPFTANVADDAASLRSLSVFSVSSVASSSGSKSISECSSSSAAWQASWKRRIFVVNPPSCVIYRRHDTPRQDLE